MNSRIYIDINGKTERAAVTENGSLAEFYLETASRRRLIGNIYKGKIVDVLPGMEAAFCNIGLIRNAYLSTTESLTEMKGEISPVSLKRDDEVLVQIVREEEGNKGTRVSLNIALPGRLLILTPNSSFIGISRRIEDEKTRDSLYKLAKKICPQGMGIVVRTLAREAETGEIEREMLVLLDLWKSIRKAGTNARCGEAVYKDNSLTRRMIRDYPLENVDKIIVSGSAIQEAEEYLESFFPKKASALELYKSKRDMFAEYGLIEEADKLLSRRVDLKCGGYLIFDKTEALTVVDVNSGKYVGDNCLSETVYRVNIEACNEIIRQVRLRNISGIIVIDFIDMNTDEHKDAVLAELRRCARIDRIKVNVTAMSPHGLVEMTRRRIGSETGGIAGSCPYCGKDKLVYSPDYLLSKLRASLIDIFIKPNPYSVAIFVSDKVFDYALESRFIAAECEGEWRGKRIYISPDSRLSLSNYRIQILPSGVVLDLPDEARLLY